MRAGVNLGHMKQRYERGMFRPMIYSVAESQILIFLCLSTLLGKHRTHRVTY